jgi:hypothetical protein
MFAINGCGDLPRERTKGNRSFGALTGCCVTRITERIADESAGVRVVIIAGSSIIATGGTDDCCDRNETGESVGVSWMYVPSKEENHGAKFYGNYIM